jgi:hypothetical protein
VTLAACPPTPGRPDLGTARGHPVAAWPSGIDAWQGGGRAGLLRPRGRGCPTPDEYASLIQGEVAVEGALGALVPFPCRESHHRGTSRPTRRRGEDVVTAGVLVKYAEFAEHFNRPYLPIAD